MKIQNTISLASIFSIASAHSIFLQLESGGTTYPVSYAIRTPSYDGPINDVTSNDVVCNGGPNPTTPSTNIINVKAGDTVQAVWRHTLTSTAANDAVYVIDPSHKGPTIAYLKKVTDATTDTGIGSGWFKIQQAGLNVATQDWAITDLIANGGYQSITIPSCIADGQYLLRAELIALHAAGSSLGAQLYIECAQINVTGGTGSATPSAVSFPGAYAQNDPGILINIYQTLTYYTIPGPTQFTCGAGGAQSTSKAASISTASTMVTSMSKPVTTSVPAGSTTTSKSSTTSAASSATTVPLYGQCGGSSWTGGTVCASGTCKVSNVYYSQCLP
jgi:cellulase